MAGPQVGDVVIYNDHVGIEHQALITASWGSETNDTPSVNLVFVEVDESKTDTWGRQVGRDSSVPHQDHQFAPGNYWRLP